MCRPHAANVPVGIAFPRQHYRKNSFVFKKGNIGQKRQHTYPEVLLRQLPTLIHQDPRIWPHPTVNHPNLVVQLDHLVQRLFVDQDGRHLLFCGQHNAVGSCEASALLIRRFSTELDLGEWVRRRESGAPKETHTQPLN